jgi:hypothetical protein
MHRASNFDDTKEMVHDKRARSTDNTELKTVFRQIAAQYRDLALQIDDPEQWRAKLIASDKAKQK